MRPRRVLPLVLTACVLASATAGRAGDGAPSPQPPVYDAGGDVALPPATAAAIDAAFAEIERPSGSAARTAASRRLAGIGPAAIPQIARRLGTAPGRVRIALVAAVAEMDAPDATPLLLRAARDPSFAVREAAVIGLGKTGDASGAGEIVLRSAPAIEPAWRVRVAAAAALRRATLRGAAERSVIGPALRAMFDDPDADVARAALEAAGPLALAETLPRVLAIYGEPGGNARDRHLALTALRAFRSEEPGLMAALRRGFLQGADAGEAVRAARAIFEVRGVDALADDEIGAGVLRHLSDEASLAMREALVALGPAAAPWLASEARHAALRVASAREEPEESPFPEIVDALFQLDESAGVELLRWALSGRDAATLHTETRRDALRRAQSGFEAKLGAELRALLDVAATRDADEGTSRDPLHADLLRAVAASGGPDVGDAVARALTARNAGVRDAAIEILSRRRSLPTPPALIDLAEHSARPDERAKALRCLGPRDPATFRRIALGFLSHPDPGLRKAAIAELGATRDPSVAEALRQRMREEDGKSSHAAPTGPETPPPAAVTGSDIAESPGRVRREVRSALVRALREVLGEAAHDDLVTAALSERDAKVRETALQELHRHGLARATDAPALLARLESETDDGVRSEIERVLAALDGSPEARAFFAARIASAALRTSALRLLGEDRAKVVPDGLAESFTNPDWGDADRVAVLGILERAGRPPEVAALAALARSAHSLDLVAEAVRVLAGSGGPAGVEALRAFLDGEKDPARRSIAARGLGETRAASAVPLLVSVFDAAREPAFASDAKTAPEFALYRDTALALGRIGTPEAARVLVAHLLHPDLAAEGARRSVMVNGPFQPEEGAVVGIVHALVCAAAQTGDEILAAAVRDAVDRLSADASAAALDKEYLDGIARLLSDPEAYGLPERRRSAAALPLWTLAARNVPRWSPLDIEAWRQTASELEQQGRIPEARRAYERSVAAADIEDAARSREDRMWERGVLLTYRAREAAAEGRTDEAVAIARSIRDADPSSGDLAYLCGRCLVKINRSDAEAAGHLRAAVARDGSDPNPLFFLAWVVQATDGAETSLGAWAEASRVESLRVRRFSPTDALNHRRGRPHVQGHFAYWQARAQAFAGDGEGAAATLADAVRRDDRFAAQALRDPAFREFADLAAVVESALREIPTAPKR